MHAATRSFCLVNASATCKMANDKNEITQIYKGLLKIQLHETCFHIILSFGEHQRTFSFVCISFRNALCSIRSNMKN